MNKKSIIIAVIFALIIVIYGTQLSVNHINVLHLIKIFWPLMIIFIGVEIAFQHRPWLVFITFLLSVLTVGAFVVFDVYIAPYSKMTTHDHTIDAIAIQESAVRAIEETDYSAAMLDIDIFNLEIIIGVSDGVDIESREQVEIDQTQLDDQVIYTIDNFGSRDHVNYLPLGISANKQWTIDIEAFTLEGELNLTNVSVDQLTIDALNVDLDIMITENYASTIDIDALQGQLDVTAEQGVGLQFVMTNLDDETRENLESAGFRQEGELIYSNAMYRDEGGVTIAIDALESAVDVNVLP